MSRIRRGRVCAAVVIALGLLTFLHLYHQPPEPLYAGKRASEWVAELGSPQYQTRNQAAQAIAMLDQAAVPALVQGLRSREPLLPSILPRFILRLPMFQAAPVNRVLLRQTAAELLADVGRHDRSTLRALIAALPEENRDVRAEVQRSLRKLAPVSMPFLADALAHRKAAIRQGAAETLRDLGPEAAAAVPALKRALQDRSESVRRQAALALGAVWRNSQVVECAALKNALMDKAAAVRAAGAEALGSLGELARPSVPALERQLQDTDPAVQFAAAKALWLVTREPDRVVPILLSLMQHSQLRWQANLVLGDIGPAAHAAIPALLAALRQEQVHRPLRTPPSSAIALGRIGTAAVPGLIESLRADSPRVRTSSAIALGFVGKGARSASLDLADLLQDPHLEVRQAATLSLAAIDPDNPALVPALKLLVGDEDIFLSGLAASHLRRLDPNAAADLGLELPR